MLWGFFSVKSILNVRLSETTDRPSNVSVLELPGDILIVPQVSQWGGKIRLYRTPYVNERSVVKSSVISQNCKPGYFAPFLEACAFSGVGKYRNNP